MSRELIESIISNNMLEANDMVEAKLAEIRERKIYEMKRMFAAKMDEAMRGQSYAQIKADLASGKKRRASDVLGLSPYDKAQEDKKKREQGKGAEAPKAKTTKAKRKAPPEAPAPTKAPEVRVKAKAKAPETPAGEDPYLGKGNAPHTMLKRGIYNIKKKISAHEPEAPGSKTLKVAKGIGSGIAKGIGGFTRELGSIGFSNLE